MSLKHIALINTSVNSLDELNWKHTQKKTTENQKLHTRSLNSRAGGGSSNLKCVEGRGQLRKGK